MKKIIITMAVALLVGVTATAQDNDKRDKHPGKRPDKTEMIKHRTDHVVKKYSLNDKQAKQLLALNTQYADKMGPGPLGHHGPHGKGRRPEISEEQKAKMEARRQERDATMKAYDVELQKIMTADQYKSYKADMEKARKEGSRGHKGPRPPRKPEA